MRHGQEPEDFIRGGAEESWLKRNNVRLAEVILGLVLSAALYTGFEAHQNGKKIDALENATQCDLLDLGQPTK